jgi:hypothetical protein
MGNTQTTLAPDIAEIVQSASTTPLGDTDQKILNATGKKCCWDDANDYTRRICQLQLIDHAIDTLLSETWKSPTVIDFASVQKKVMTYKDVNGHPDESDEHDWSILSDDDLSFKVLINGLGMRNPFKQFEQLPVVEAHTQLRNFESYILTFAVERDNLMSRMKSEIKCE